MNAAEIAAAIERGEKDPLPYAAGTWRAGSPFSVIHGSVTGATYAPPTGWIENAEYAPRWYTDDQYADLIEHENRTTVARARRGKVAR